MPENAIPGVAERVALRTLARRGTDYAGEVRRLLDAGLEVMRRSGTTTSPRVADIVAEAGLSNDAFYRHFASKEALVAAILEDGTERLASYLAHQMDKEQTAEGRLRRWVEGVMAQAADAAVAESTLAVLWNGGRVSESAREGHGAHYAPLASLLHDPLVSLGSADPERDAVLIAHATMGRMQEFLWRRTRPTATDTAHVQAFCLAAISRPPTHSRSARPRHV
jgi:AcrR family transcriptional regulator